jgi:hypothetical protein
LKNIREKLIYPVVDSLREEVSTGFRWENLRERGHLVDPGLDGRILLRQIFRKWYMGVWTGLSWLKIETGGGHL